MNKTFPVDTFIANSTLDYEDAPSDLLDEFDEQIESTGGSFFFDNTTLYLFSGMGENSTKMNKVATYDTVAGNWSSSPVAGGSYSFGDRTSLLSASVPQIGKSFALGG